MIRKPTPEKLAFKLAKLQQLPCCEGCDVLRGANEYGLRYYGKKKGKPFADNLKTILTEHVDLGCDPCHVEKVVESIKCDRLAAIAALL
jgi:hypothetical protein